MGAKVEGMEGGKGVGTWIDTCNEKRLFVFFKREKKRKEKNNIALFQGKVGARSLQYIYFMY